MPSPTEELNQQRLYIFVKIFILFLFLTAGGISLYHFVISKNNKIFNVFNDGENEKNEKKTNWLKFGGYILSISLILTILLMMIGEAQFRYNSSNNNSRCVSYLIYGIFGNKDIVCDTDF